MKNKKRLIILITIILLLIPAFLFLVPIKQGRNFVQEVKYRKLLAGATQPDNYDKMKISYAQIIERKTGTERFNTSSGHSIDDGSVLSDMDGNDVSEKDDYVRTNDTIYYRIEVGVALNLDNPDVIETTRLNGGVIKIKGILPKASNGDQLFAFEKDSWMSNFRYADSLNEIYAEYVVSEDELLAGGNQQLSFTVHTINKTYSLTGDEKPTFEIWMEGNKPDNEQSLVESISIKDEKPIYITGKVRYNLQMIKGKINDAGEYNGVKGQYINIIPALLQSYTSYTSDYQGVSYPDLNQMYTKIKVDYYYRDKSSNSEEYVKYPDNVMNDVKLVTYNINTGDSNNEAYPTSTSNYLDTTEQSYGWQSLYGKIDDYFSSGDLNVTYNNGYLTTTNTDFYSSFNFFSGYKTFDYARGPIFINAIEMFMPFMNDGNEYDYMVTFTFDDFGSNEDSYYEDMYLRDNSTTFTFSDYLLGEFNIELDSSPTYYGSYDSDSGYAVSGTTTTLQSILDVDDGPYLGGEKRLITFDSGKISLTKRENKDTYYYYGGYYSSTESDDGTIKYGIYKNNPNDGLTTNELVNSTLEDDFDWYDSVEEAEEHGKVTAVLWDNPKWEGNKNAAYFKIYFKPVEKEENYGKVAIARHKIWVYGDQARTKKYEAYTDSSEDYYKPTVYNEKVVIQTMGRPWQAGESIRIDKGFALLSGDVSLDKYYYNVLDNKVKFRIDYHLSEVKGIVDHDTDYINYTLYVDKRYLSYNENTCNIAPVTARVGTKYLYLFWTIETPALGPYPVVECNFDIDPFTPNNTKLEYETGRTYLSSHTTWGGSGGIHSWFYVMNLSGSSTRKTPSKEYIEKDESFNITGNVNNISDETLNNVKTIELLPKDGDSRTSIIHGSYSIELTDMDEGVSVYYSTGDIDNIGIETDEIGYKHIKNVDLANDSRWIQVDVGETIPSDATAIASLTNSISSKTSKGYTYKVIPSGNQKGDIYYFGQYASSDQLIENIFSTYKPVTVVERKISGKVFEDLNRSDVYNSSDALLKDYQIELLNESGTKIDETVTDSNGYYEFSVPNSGKYYIRFANLPDGYELTPKGLTDSYSKVNSNMKTDLIDHTQPPQEAIYMISNINLGIRKKVATLTIKYLDKNNDNNLADPVIRTVYYTDTYETEGLTTIPENYSFLENAGDPVTEVVNKDNIEVIYYYDYTPATVTARHYLDGTTTKIHEDVTQDKKFTQPYSTSHLTLSDYDYVRTDGDAEEGTVSKTSYVVNYYYKYKVGTVTTHHYLYDNGDTTTKVAPDVSKEWNYTETYTTSISDEVPANYEFYKKSTNHTAIISSPSVEVNYYYRLKDSNLTTSITKTGDSEITSKDAEVNYTITYNGTVKDYIGDGTITIIDTLPYKIDVENSNLDGGTYNASNKTITWIESWNSIDTYASNNNEVTKEITKNIKLVYDGIVGRDRIMTNTTKGTIILSNNSRDAQAQTSTSIKIKGKIKVIYIDVETEEELFDSVEEEDLVGEQFISESHEKDGYKIVTRPENETFEFEEDEQLITYGYEHIKYEVKGVVLGGGGTITGDEDVFWGEDSTEGNIKIIADEGYVIESVIINGEEIDIEPGQEEMVLGQFLNMLENKNIEVTFIKKPAENPNTRSFIGIFALVISLLVILILFIKRKSFKKIRYEQ